MQFDFCTDLRLFDSALLEGTSARVMGTVMSVFTPVTLVGAADTRQTPGGKKIKIKKMVGVERQLLDQ